HGLATEIRIRRSGVGFDVRALRERRQRQRSDQTKAKDAERSTNERHVRAPCRERDSAFAPARARRVPTRKRPISRFYRGKTPDSCPLAAVLSVPGHSSAAAQLPAERRLCAPAMIQSRNALTA